MAGRLSLRLRRARFGRQVFDVRCVAGLFIGGRPCFGVVGEPVLDDVSLVKNKPGRQTP